MTFLIFYLTLWSYRSIWIIHTYLLLKQSSQTVTQTVISMRRVNNLVLSAPFVFPHRWTSRLLDSDAKCKSASATWAKTWEQICSLGQGSRGCACIFSWLCGTTGTWGAHISNPLSLAVFGLLGPTLVTIVSYSTAIPAKDPREKI